MANAKFITEENQAQNGVSVKWYEITGLTGYPDDGIYGLYSDGSVVDDENYPLSDNADRIINAIENS
jgi:hypothetical protein